MEKWVVSGLEGELHWTSIGRGFRLETYQYLPNKYEWAVFGFVYETSEIVQKSEFVHSKVVAKRRAIRYYKQQVLKINKCY